MRGEVGAGALTGRLERRGEGDGRRTLTVRADDLNDAKAAVGLTEKGEELGYAFEPEGYVAAAVELVADGAEAGGAVADVGGPCVRDTLRAGASGFRASGC